MQHLHNSGQRQYLKTLIEIAVPGLDAAATTHESTSEMTDETPRIQAPETQQSEFSIDNFEVNRYVR
jgi:hypothetical protein